MLRSHWIELLAVPITSALMEAQPIALVVDFLGPKLAGSIKLPVPISIVLLLVVMQWWMMGVQGLVQKRRIRARSENLYLLAGASVGAMLLALCNVMALDDPTFLVIAALLLIWAWWRGRMRARDPLNDSYLGIAFRAGFVAMMCIMIFAVLSNFMGDTTTNDELIRDMPIFFVAGLISLSYTRIATLQREQARQVGGSVKESTGTWIIAQTVVWGLLILLSTLLESLPLDAFANALSPLWTVLSFIGLGVLFLLGLIAFVFVAIAGLFIGLIFWIVGLFSHQSPQSTPKTSVKAASDAMKSIQHGNQISPIFLIIIGVVLLLILAFIVFRLSKRLRSGEKITDADSEEVRENLDRNAILNERKAQKKHSLQSVSEKLEELDPASIRARYRDFLQSMAEQGGEMQRQGYETPQEYQQRILVIARRKRLLPEGDVSANPEVLAELTNAYIQERYGGKSVASVQRQSLEQNVPRLVQKLANSSATTPPKPVNTWSAQKARWGEDN